MNYEETGRKANTLKAEDKSVTNMSNNTQKLNFVSMNKSERAQRSYNKEKILKMSESRLSDFVEKISHNKELWRMGHNQQIETLDIGLGWLYYGLAKSLKPVTIVIIGSWRGFVPLVMGQALEEIGSGEVVFIDPSFVDNQWKKNVDKYFEEYGIKCIKHHLMTSEQFIESERFRGLKIDMLFIDGMHTYEQCKFEFEAFSKNFANDFTVILHDSASKKISNIYGKEKQYQVSVWEFVEELQQDNNYEVINIPIDRGIAIIKPRLKYSNDNH